MINSSQQLIKYKKALKDLNKLFPKDETSYCGFTIDVSLGGNKKIDFNRLSVGGVSSDKNVGDDFLKLMKQSIEDNIKFWEANVKREIKEMQKALDN